MLAYFNGEVTPDTGAVERALSEGIAVLPPVVLTEVLSFPAVPPELVENLEALPRLELDEGYWVRGGWFQAALLRAGTKARLADTLIATSCIDHDAVLITRDTDFRHFTRFGLRLAGPEQE